MPMERQQESEKGFIYSNYGHYGRECDGIEWHPSFLQLLKPGVPQGYARFLLPASKGSSRFGAQGC